MVAPKDTPAEIVARVQGEFAKAAARAEIKTRLNDLRAEPVLNTPEDFRREWRAEAAMWERAIQKAGIKVQ